MPPERECLSKQEITARLAQPGFDGWLASEGCLHRTFEFHDFVATFGWMTSVALVAERLNHHPDWKNVYRTVNVRLSTHDAGGVSDLDFRLASNMNKLASLHRGSN